MKNRKMKIEYYHASKYGNGVIVAEEFKKQMTARGFTVNIHHVPDAKPKDIPQADLYLFSSPGRFGKPAFCMRRFLKKIKLPQGSKYAVLVTELSPKTDKKTGQAPSETELGKCQQVIPFLNQVLKKKGLVNIAESKILVNGFKGPLEEGWQKKVENYASQISSIPDFRIEGNPTNSLIMCGT